MQNLRIEKGQMIIDLHNDNRFYRTKIVKENGEVSRLVVITATYEFIVSKLGKEYLDDNQKMEEWMVLQAGKVFDEFQNNPKNFQGIDIVKIFSNPEIQKVILP